MGICTGEEGAPVHVSIIPFDSFVCQVGRSTNLQRGQLDNKAMPRMVIVFEGAIGILPEDNTKNYNKYASKGQWWRAVDCFEINESMTRKILDLGWRLNYNITIVTWMSEDAAQAVEEKLNFLPIRGCFYSSPSQLAMDLPFNPEIIKVYDPDPAHVFTYGGKGVVLTSPTQLGR